jgi:hypothetical protein
MGASEPELMSDLDIHGFGVEIVHDQLKEAGWTIYSADVFADSEMYPQIVGTKDGEMGYFVVRTAMYPARGRIEGEAVYRDLVRHARDHGATCYFASVGLANSTGTTEEEMAIPVKGVAYHVAFDGLVRMELPPEEEPSA